MDDDCGELRHELARVDFYIYRPIGAALPSPFGPDCFVGGSSEPRLTRWRRLDVAPWELHDATYRFVVSKAGLERQLTLAPAEMSVLRQVQRSPAVAPAAAPPRQRRAKRGTPRELCKLLIPEAYPKAIPEGEPNKEIIRKIRPLMEKRGWSWSDVTILRAFERHPQGSAKSDSLCDEN